MLEARLKFAARRLIAVIAASPVHCSLTDNACRQEEATVIARHILVPIDGSQHSEVALEHALGLARALAARITVLRVSGAPAHLAIAGIELTALPAEVKDEIARRIEQDFSRARKRAAEQLVVVDTLRVESDNPARGILESAARLGCDLIVMAMHGRDVLTRRLGSVTFDVLAASPVPVLIVH